MITPEQIESCEEALKNGFIIKSRDDQDLIAFIHNDADNKYEIASDFNCGWIEDGTISDSDVKSRLRERIEPWLTALFQSEHLSLLCGSGLTNSISYLAGANGGANMDPNKKFSVFADHIDNAAKESAKRTGRNDANTEDYIRSASELLRGMQIMNSKRASQLENDLKSVLSEFATSIIAGENGIAVSVKDKREKAFNTLVNFLLSFCSRTGNRERLHIFTTNYDRLIEAGAELAGIHLLDRFVGNLMPVFRSSRLNLDIHYNPPGIKNEPRYLEGVARYTKLHGSVDWVQVEDEIRRFGLPFGALDIKPYLEAPGLKGCDELKLIIYPNSAKDKETAEYPYVELFRDFAAAICRPNSTVVTYGYGFGDDHINRVIKDMLTIPSTHLVIISFSDPGSRILNFYQKVSRPAQITVMMGNLLGDISNLTEMFLPKAAIDNTTLRMVDLLQKRMGATNATAKANDPA